MNIIPQTSPKANYQARKTEIDAAVQEVLHSGKYILGEQVTAFEYEFASYIGSAYCIGVASGTDALELSLRTCDIGPGDGVLTVSHTAVATVTAIELVGAVPVFVDTDRETFTMDPNHLADTIEGYLASPSSTGRARLKAVIPVHLYGHPADMSAILRIATQYGLRVIEDCAQSHGAFVSERMTGCWGDLAAFSFYPTKNLGALGDGGAVVTNDTALAEKTNMLRQYGWRQRYISDIPGMNSRLDEVQAAILRVKLRHLSKDNGRRRELASRYSDVLASLPIVLPTERSDARHVYHQYAIRTSRRDSLKASLDRQNISTTIHYPMPIHLQPAYKARLGQGTVLRNTETVSREVLSLPMFPELTDEELQHVGESIVKWCRSEG